MRLRTALMLLALSSCLIPTTEHPLGAVDGGVPGFRCRTVFGQSVQTCVALAPVATCGGKSCAVGEECCITTGACVSPDAGSCPVLATTWTYSPGDLRACGKSSDCRAEEYCMLDERQDGPGPRCLGSGHCMPITSCSTCNGPRERCQVCGCDGVTYDSPQAACVAGVNVASGVQGPCGTPGGHDGGAFTYRCGTSAQCPAGAQCCGLTGLCFDPLTEPWRCEKQQDGTILNCANHSECLSGAGGGSGSEPPTSLCGAATCEGPGLCLRRGSTNDCSGVVQSVCGCDGLTYVNECWARAAGVRVASQGACR